jgi:hypothetical protein
MAGRFHWQRNRWRVMRDLVCDYCRAPAVDTIPTTPERVCRAHAELF